VSESDDQQRTLALLEANHAFPGDYPLTVIARNDEAVTAAVLLAIQEVLREALGEGLGEGLGASLPETAREQRLSAGGKYVSHRLSVPCAAAIDVVRLYERVRRVDGVMTVL
jgi:putative lipoic acid-binding regulatory protein